MIITAAKYFATDFGKILHLLFRDNKFCNNFGKCSILEMTTRFWGIELSWTNIEIKTQSQLFNGKLAVLETLY